MSKQLAGFTELKPHFLGLIPTIPKIEFPTPLRDLSATLARITPDLTPLLEKLREKLPPNWPSDIDFSNVTEVIQDDGVPIVWVPRAEIVQMLLAAEDRPARVAVLLAHAPELLADCRSVLGEMSHTTLSGQASLAVKALEAFEDGHHEAAQALAVTVTETAVAHVLDGTYGDVAKKVLFDPRHVTFAQLRLRAALAPIGPFYQQRWPNSGAPLRVTLSRHVTVHQADQRHYTPGNAAVAVLLVTSVLRALQELQELTDASRKAGISTFAAIHRELRLPTVPRVAHARSGTHPGAAPARPGAPHASPA